MVRPLTMQGLPETGGGEKEHIEGIYSERHLNPTEEWSGGTSHVSQILGKQKGT